MVSASGYFNDLCFVWPLHEEQQIALCCVLTTLRKLRAISLWRYYFDGGTTALERGEHDYVWWTISEPLGTIWLSWKKVNSPVSFWRFPKSRPWVYVVLPTLNNNIPRSKGELVIGKAAYVPSRRKMRHCIEMSNWGQYTSLCYFEDGVRDVILQRVYWRNCVPVVSSRADRSR
jgi:hypothetical protein